MRTEGSGLAAFAIDARQPSFRFVVTVEDEGGQSRVEELLRPYGRAMLLRMEPAVWTPEQPVVAELTTWRPDVEVHCDLIQDRVHLWSRWIKGTGLPIALTIGTLPEGRYSLQCYDHPFAIGEAYATMPVVVSAAPPLGALLTEVGDRQIMVAASVTAPNGTDKALAVAWWQAVLRDEPREPDILLTTRRADLTEREAAYQREKTALLVAISLVFLLVLAWMVESILKNIVETRDRLRTYEAEALMDAHVVDTQGFVPGDQLSRDALLKTRGVLIMIVFVGTLIANVVGLIWLFAIIR